jgi:hypothetical protein
MDRRPLGDSGNLAATFHTPHRHIIAHVVAQQIVITSETSYSTLGPSSIIHRVNTFFKKNSKTFPPKSRLNLIHFHFIN